MAVRFDAATDRVTYAPGDASPPDAFTVVMWVYLSAGLLNYTSLYRRYTAGGSGRGQIGTDEGGLALTWWPSGVPFGHTLGVGQWSRVAVAVSGGTVTTYAGAPTGALTKATGSSGTVAGANNVTLAGVSAGSGAEWLNGRLARVRTFSGVLSDAQIEAEFAATAPVAPGIWADWDLPDADDLTDHSGAGRHLAAGTTAVTTEDGPPNTAPSGMKLWTGSAWTDTPIIRHHDGSAWQTAPAVRTIGT